MRKQLKFKTNSLFLLCLTLLLNSVSFAQTSQPNRIHKQTFYDLRQTVVKEDYYVNSVGEKDGKYKLFAENGILKEEATYKKGQLNGSDIKYGTITGTQTLESKETYKDGILDGPATYYRAFSMNDLNKVMVQSAGNFKNSSKEGDWIIYSDYNNSDYNVDLTDEQKKGCEYIKSIRVYHNDKPTLKEGKFTETFYPSEKIYDEGTVYNGKLIGKVLVYYPNGQKQIEAILDSNGAYIDKKTWSYDGKLTYNSATAVEEKEKADKQLVEKDKRYIFLGDSVLGSTKFSLDGANLASKCYSYITNQNLHTDYGSLYTVLLHLDEAMQQKEYGLAIDKLKYIENSIIKADDYLHKIIDNRISEIQKLKDISDIPQKIKELTDSLGRKYNEFKSLYVEEKSTGVNDINTGRPTYNEIFLKGEYLYKKSNSIIQNYFSAYNATDDYSTKLKISEQIKSAIERMKQIAVSTDNKDLNKQLKKVDNPTDIKLILGLN